MRNHVTSCDEFRPVRIAAVQSHQLTSLALNGSLDIEKRDNFKMSPWAQFLSWNEVPNPGNTKCMPANGRLTPSSVFSNRFCPDTRYCARFFFDIVCSLTGNTLNLP